MGSRHDHGLRATSAAVPLLQFGAFDVFQNRTWWICMSHDNCRFLLLTKSCSASDLLATWLNWIVVFLGLVCLCFLAWKMPEQRRRQAQSRVNRRIWITATSAVSCAFVAAIPRQNASGRSNEPRLVISLQIPTLAERLGASFAAGLGDFGQDAGSDRADGASVFGKNIRRARDFGRRGSQGKTTIQHFCCLCFKLSWWGSCRKRSVQIEFV